RCAVGGGDGAGGDRGEREARRTDLVDARPCGHGGRGLDRVTAVEGGDIELAPVADAVLRVGDEAAEGEGSVGVGVDARDDLPAAVSVTGVGADGHAVDALGAADGPGDAGAVAEHDELK